MKARAPAAVTRIPNPLTVSSQVTLLPRAGTASCFTLVSVRRIIRWLRPLSVSALCQHADVVGAVADVNGCRREVCKFRLIYKGFRAEGGESLASTKT